MHPPATSSRQEKERLRGPGIFSIGLRSDGRRAGSRLRAAPPGNASAHVCNCQRRSVGEQTMPSCFVWASTYWLATFAAAQAGNYSRSEAFKPAEPIPMLRGWRAKAPVLRRRPDDLLFPVPPEPSWYAVCADGAGPLRLGCAMTPMRSWTELPKSSSMAPRCGSSLSRDDRQQPEPVIEI